MSASLEQKYYEMLTRTDHPVFRRDFSEVQDGDSGFNAILNRVLAKQLVRLRSALDAVQANAFPQTADETAMSKWEERYFGFDKPQVGLTERAAEVLVRKNRRIRMSITDVRAICLAITGQVAYVIRNMFFDGWVLDVGVLDVDTIFVGTDQANYAQLYVVAFAQPVDSILLTRLDEYLTRIEKGGARHILRAPPPQWVLGRSALDFDTILG